MQLVGERQSGGLPPRRDPAEDRPSKGSTMPHLNNGAQPKTSVNGALQRLGGILCFRNTCYSECTSNTACCAISSTFEGVERKKTSNSAFQDLYKVWRARYILRVGWCDTKSTQLKSPGRTPPFPSPTYHP